MSAVTNGTTAGEAFSGDGTCLAAGVGYTTLTIDTEDTDMIVVKTQVDDEGTEESNKVEVE